AQRPAIDHRARVIARAKHWAHRLGVEKIESDKTPTPGCNVKRAGQPVGRREYVVELCKEVRRLLLGFIGAERQGEVRNFFKIVLDAFREIELVGDQRAVERQTRRRLTQTAQVAAAYSELGQWIIQLDVPLVAAATCLYRNDRRSKSAKLGKVRCL